jgi:hypothetical protein
MHELTEDVTEAEILPDDELIVEAMIGDVPVTIQEVNEPPRMSHVPTPGRGKYDVLFDRMTPQSGLKVETSEAASALSNALRAYIKRNNIKGRARKEKHSENDWRIYLIRN